MKTSHKFAAAAGSMFAGSFVLAQSGALEPLVATMGAIGVACGIGAMIVGDGEYEVPAAKGSYDTACASAERDVRPETEEPEARSEAACRRELVEAAEPFGHDLLEAAMKDGRKDYQTAYPDGGSYTVGLPEGVRIEVTGNSMHSDGEYFVMRLDGENIARGVTYQNDWDIHGIEIDEKQAVEAVMQRFRALRQKVAQVKADQMAEAERRAEIEAAHWRLDASKRLRGAMDGLK